MTKSASRQRIILRLLISTLSVALISSCSTHLTAQPQVKGIPRLEKSHYVSFDQDQFGYKKWLHSPKKYPHPDTIIIGVHGISGHAEDYDNLGNYLLKHANNIALYAPETRGQGSDPIKSRRGDIHSPKDWFRDLYTFTRLIRKKYPHSKIIWFGESMGSLIVAHAYTHPPHGEKKPDALVLSSPIIGVTDQVPAWKMTSLKATSALLPKLRISLETLSTEQPGAVTKDDIHKEQAAKNSWYIPRYTLRLLLHLNDLSTNMDEAAAQIHCPILILNGGKDIFSSPKNVDHLTKQFPAKPANQTQHKFYPGSYHLLMYDHDRKKIFSDVLQWLQWLRKNP